VHTDRRLLVAALLLAATLLVVGTGGEYADDQAVEPAAGYLNVTNDTQVWPYTSHARGFHGRTLAINVVVYGHPVIVEHQFRERARGDWNETAAEEVGEEVDPVERAPNGTSIAWDTAAGANRYVFVQPVNGTGRWYAESFQLHDGDYFGSRHHVRAYTSPEDEPWVAMQAHHEHWDWFRLRHSVDGVAASQAYVEQEFMGRWFVTDISREYVGNDLGPDMRGWVTVIRFGAPGVAGTMLLLVGVPALRRLNRYTAERREQVEAYVPEPRWRIGMLAGALCALYLVVRFGAIGLERLVPSLHPYVIAGAFYPLLFVGLPAVAVVFSRRVDRPAAFVAATVGFATALFLDYTYLNVTVLTLATMVHRLSLAVSLGLIAAGAHRPDRESPPDRGGYLRLGLLLWLVALGHPMLRFV
jgi:hypothetical protein